jgi:hypothetical protein
MYRESQSHSLTPESSVIVAVSVLLKWRPGHRYQHCTMVQMRPFWWCLTPRKSSAGKCTLSVTGRAAKVRWQVCLIRYYRPIQLWKQLLYKRMLKSVPTDYLIEKQSSRISFQVNNSWSWLVKLGMWNMDTALEKTRVRDQNSIVQQIQRVRLYKDQVIRKTGKVIGNLTATWYGVTGNQTICNSVSGWRRTGHDHRESH